MDIRYAHTLTKRVWTQFPDMAIEFWVPFDQFVAIKYKIGVRMASDTWFVSKM